MRSPIKTGEQATPAGSGEGKDGLVGRLLRIIKRDKVEVEEVSEGSSRKKTGPRRVRAMLTVVDPWSVMKLGFLVSIAMGIAMVVAVAIIWSLLNEFGVFASINSQITTVLGPEAKVDFLKYTDRNKILSATLLLAVVNTILITGLFTIGAFLYNMVVKLVGGVYITLSDE